MPISNKLTLYWGKFSSSLETRALKSYVLGLHARKQVVLYLLCDVRGTRNILVNRQHMLPGRCAGAVASATGPPRQWPPPSTHSHHTPNTHTLCLQTSPFHHLFPKRSRRRQVKLTRMPTNCFSAILVDVTMPRLCCRSRTDASSASTLGRLLLLLPLLFSFYSPALWGVWPPLVRASSVPSASVAGVALLLCANSALIQKLFYAVKRTCDRGSEGREGIGWGWGWGGVQGKVKGGRRDNKLFSDLQPQTNAQ